MIRPRWRKVLSDLWDNKARTLLVVASISVGVFAIGMIAGAFDIITEDVSTGHAATNPANIQLSIAPFDPDFVKAVRRRESVATAEGRRTVTLRLKTGPDIWTQLSLVAIPDFAEVRNNLHLPLQGATAPGDREVLIERKAWQSLGVEVGDVLEVELSDGTRREIPVVGVVQEPSASLGNIFGNYKGFITLDTLEWLGYYPTLDRLYISVAEDHNDSAHIQDVVDEITELVEKSGRWVYQQDKWRSDEYPLESLVAALAGVLGTLGVLTVSLSGTLISNTMSSLLNTHLRQIGIMKLVGARRRDVIGMYLTLIGAFSLIALAAAIPLGSWGAYALARMVADKMNFVLQGYRLVPRALLLQMIVGLAVPPVVGLLPILQGSRVTVSKAFGNMGLTDSSSSYKLWNGKRGILLRRISRPLLISVRNTFRRRGRLALTLLTLLLGGAIFIAVFNVQASLNLQVSQITRYFMADVNLDLGRLHRAEEIDSLARTVPGVESVEAWTFTLAELLDDDGSVADNVRVIALPADSGLIAPTLLEGRWLVPGDETAIAVSEAFWQDYPDLRSGDRLRLKLDGYEDDWTVVGILQFTGMDDLLAYANYDYVSRLLEQPGQAAAYRIVTTEHSQAFQERVGALLYQRFSELGYHVQGIEGGAAFVENIAENIDILIAVLLVMALLTALVGSIGLAGTLSMNVMERTREIGVMRAIGAHNRIIAGLVVGEGLIIGFMSFALAVLLSFPITRVLSDIISLAIFNHPAEFVFTGQGLAIWMVVVLFMSVIASIVPARSACRLTIREVLAYQ